MRHIRLALIAVYSMAMTGTAEDPRAPAYSDHAKLMVYMNDAGAEVAVKTPRDWSVRRRHIVSGMERAMGPMPDRSNLPALDLRVLEESPGDGYTRRTISFVAEEGDRVPAHLYLPVMAKPSARAAGVLALHPTSPLGKRVVAGLGPRPNRGYAVELAERGYVVIAPDYPSFGDYAGYDFASDRYESGTMKGIFNHMRCVDVLQSLDVVAPDRIGAIGHSLGGHSAMFVGVFDERIKVIVSSCGWTPFHDYYGGNLKGWTSDRYMPRLRDVYSLDPNRVPFDFYEVVAALAPRGFFSNSPRGDDNFAVAGVEKAIPRAREVYQLLGAEDRLEVRHPESGHDFPVPVRNEAYEFMDRVLTHVPARSAVK